jgi:Holliday junction resolvase-like predicted endonuclease
MESLEHSIDSRKRGKIRKTASLFLLRHPELGGCRIRFDLIFLSRRMEKLDHWENAF